MRKPRQLFVTQSRVLAGKVEEYFRKLHESIEIADLTPKMLKDGPSTTQHAQLNNDLLHVDDDTKYRVDLPRRFSELRDQHFPLFLTMEKLSDLIEADVADETAIEPSSSSHVSIDVQQPRQLRKRELLDYTIWLSHYWPHFAEHLTKGLGMSSVLVIFIALTLLRSGTGVL